LELIWPQLEEGDRIEALALLADLLAAYRKCEQLQAFPAPSA
jgi:hypothetical protein